MARAVDRHEDFVHVPSITELATTAPKVIGIVLTELKAPLANRLIGPPTSPSVMRCRGTNINAVGGEPLAEERTFNAVSVRGWPPRLL